MKYKLHKSRRSQPWQKYVLILMLLAQAPVSAQLLAQTDKAPKQSGQQPSTFPLIEALAKLKAQHRVNILFEEKKLQNRAVSADALNPRNTLEANLTALLQPLGLSYKKRKNNYIILSEGASSLHLPASKSEEPPVNALPQPLLPNENKGEPVSPPTVKDRNVSGKVTDEKGEALPGVNILVKGTQRGMITDVNGKFSIEVSDESTVLVFSFVGYLSEEVVAGGRSQIDITLKADEKALEEVVVVGYGTQSKKMLTGAVSSVKSEQLTVAPVSNVTNLLAGRLPGLVSKQESGRPGGDAASLNIRGFGTPLVIVDGIQASFSTLDPNTIESVTILKDASAAIYGARAGNGVILVTTKRGTSGKPVIEFRSDWTYQGVTNMPKLTSSGQRAELIREGHLNAGNPESTARFTQEDVDKFYSGTDPDYPNTDWLKVASDGWAPQSQNNLSLRGGNEKIRYYGFLGYLNQKTMFKNGGKYERYNLQSNIDAQITESLNLQLDITGIVEKRLFPWRDQDSDVWQEYWTSEPFWSPTLPNGEIAYGGAGASIGLHYVTNMSLSNAYRRGDKTDLRGTLTLEQKFKSINGLSARIFANYNQIYSFDKNFSYLADSWSYNNSNHSYTQWSSKTPPQLSHLNSRNRILTGQLSLKYERNLGEKHNISALALYEVIDFYNDAISASRTNFNSTSIDYLFAGGVDSQFNGGSASEMGRQSYVGRVNYAFDSKYLIEAILRVDESAKFVQQSRRGVFPNVSLGWRLSEENLIKDNIHKIDNLKLRASYGVTGMDEVGSFKYLSGYNYGSRYIIGSTPSVGLIATELANPSLTWEQMKTYNIGLDFGLTKNLVFAELDFFYRDRDKIPGTRVTSLPTTFGANLPVVNLNRMSTRGFELNLGHEGRRGDFRWNVSGNISWNRSRWEYYDEPAYDDEDSERLSKRTGKWTDRTFGYKSDGLFTSQEEIAALDFVYDEGAGNRAVLPGTIRYIDTNGDGLLNWRDQVEIGKGTTPRWMGGVNILLNYGQFDLSALFQGAFGFYNNVVIRSYSTLQYDERWTPENNSRNGLVPRSGVAYTALTSDFYFKKADYLRLKTFSVGYNVPASLTKKVNVDRMRIYAAGVNLLTFSGLNKYFVDPEAPSGRAGYYYPQTRTVSFGVNLSF